jgi:hypothetical protein
VQKVKEGTADFGYNARTDKYENLIAAGVIDPTKVGQGSFRERGFNCSYVVNNRSCIGRRS